MNVIPDLRFLPLLIALPFSGQALAVGGSLSSGQIDPITRQVEQKTQRMMEQAMNRQLQQQVQERASERPDIDTALPDVLSIKTREGEPAFNEVRLESGVRVVERQWLATASDVNLKALQRPGITILDRQQMDGLGMTVVHFRVSRDLDSRRALEAILPGMLLDRNHIYEHQTRDEDSIHKSMFSDDAGSLCTGDFGVGMMDSSIDTSHPFFQGADIVQQAFLSVPARKSRLLESKAHGTAVASVMVGGEERTSTRLPNVRLFNASVFYKRERHLSGATLGHLLEGLNWLAQQSLLVINISLTGPPNALLEQVIKRLNEKGLLMVAAVGNLGPAAPPLFPAAYAEVIGVTAVDGNGDIYRWANQGEQVMFAARGVDITVAAPDKGLMQDSGTSLAAPIVTAALACQRANTSVKDAVTALIRSARDLGSPGRDSTFGHGLIDP